MERRIQNKFIKSAYSDSGLVNKFSPRVGEGVWRILEEIKGFHGERSINEGGDYRKLMASEGEGGGH